jgi:hypothetical protein
MQKLAKIAKFFRSKINCVSSASLKIQPSDVTDVSSASSDIEIYLLSLVLKNILQKVIIGQLSPKITLFDLN